MRRFSHKLMLLVEAVLAEVARFSVRPDRFAVQQCAADCEHACVCGAAWHIEWASLLCSSCPLIAQTCIHAS